MSVFTETTALRVGVTRAATGIAGLLLFLTLLGSPVAHGFKGAVTIGPAAPTDEFRDVCGESLAPEASECSQKAAHTTAAASMGSICRTRYTGATPEFTVPPPYIVDVALPSIYCENVNQWVFIYPARGGTQLYRLDPSKRQSYRVIFSEAAKGATTPWALRRARSRGTIYFVNMEPARTKSFDYTVSARRFDVCLELAALPQLRIVSAENMEACRQPGELAHTTLPD